MELRRFTVAVEPFDHRIIKKHLKNVFPGNKQ